MNENPFLLQRFMDLTANLTTAQIFREWSAVVMVSATVARRCWVQINAGTEPFYPNMFVLAVGEPGTGKSQAIDVAESLLRRSNVKVAPDTITREQLWRRMAESMDAYGDTEHDVASVQSALTVANSEVGNFIPEKDTEFMRALAKLYDCPAIYHYETKNQSGKDHMKDFIDQPCLNILGGVQPRWMKDALPEHAFETGFPARLMLIHSGSELMPNIELAEPTSSLHEDPRYSELVGNLRDLDRKSVV